MVVVIQEKMKHNDCLTKKNCKLFKAMVVQDGLRRLVNRGLTLEVVIDVLQVH